MSPWFLSDDYAILIAMNSFDLLRQRLLNQRLAGAPGSTPAEVVQWLGAVQAQDHLAAKWAIGLRALNTTDKDVEQALNAGKLLRTHVLRPTWHFVTPADIRWMLELTAPYIHRRMATYDRQLGLDNAL